MFGLEMKVIAPYPDALDDGIEMDTVRYWHLVSIIIKYKNLTDSKQRDFEITTFFPNRFESYTKLISWNRRPDYVDHPDSSIQASWKFGDLAPLDSGTIELSLRVNRAPKDTIYLSYETVARAKWTPVSQVSHTNIYVPGGEGIAPYPNLLIDKIADADEVFPGDTIQYTIRYENIGEIGSIPAEAVAIFDTLPAHFTLLENQYTPAIDSLPDGRLLLIWDLQHIVPYSFIGSISFRVRVDLIADHDSLIYNSALITSSTNEISLINNRDREPVLVKPKIDLAIEQEGPNQYNLFPDDSQNFNLKCTNLSSIDLDNITVIVKINDGVADFNIYSFQDLGEGRTTPGDTLIYWNILNLPSQQSTTRSFSIILNKVDKSQNYTINFVAEIDTTVILVDRIHRDVDTSNNHDEWVIQIDGTPNLSVDLMEINNRISAEPNSTLNFKLICRNSSCSALDSINVRAWIEGDSIFTITKADGKTSDNKLIKWKLPPLSYQESIEKTFDLTFDKIFDPDNYNIKIVAAIDTLEIDPQDFIDNVDSWDVSVNAMPEVKLGPISIQPDLPALRNIIEYTIPYSNNGNFPATNSIMTIERPDFTYMLYYIHDNSTNYLEDSTVATIQIPLGDLEPDSEESILVGLRIYSFKQLPSNLSSPLSLVFKSTITYDLGEVTASRADDVPFVFIASLILDKNIVEPDKLPLKITFKSSDFGNVDIKIYNLAGEFIKTVYIGPVEKGDTYIYDWDGLNEQGSTVSSGVYFVYAVSKFYNGYKKVVIVK